jgi:hypothetical protein
MNSGELFGIRFDAKMMPLFPLGVYKNLEPLIINQNIGPGGQVGYENIIYGALGILVTVISCNMTYFPMPYGQGYNVILVVPRAD